MTDEKSLRERIARALWDFNDGVFLPLYKDHTDALADAVLPLVREAQAGALRDAATEYRRGYAVSRPPVAVERFLKHRADEIEESADDE